MAHVLVGKASAADKNTVIQITVFGSYDGIITNLDYKIISNNNKLEEFLNTIKSGIIGAAATDAIEEIIVDNILENIELENDEIYIAELIEKVFQKAIFNYLQVQLDVPIEPTYDYE